MATAGVDDGPGMIICSICLETYKNPKCLPCLHTFCKTCLSQLITSAFKTSSSKSFPCPNCRQDVPVSDPSLSPEEIASKLPASHLIVTLLDQHRLRSKNKQCDPCALLGEQNAAVSWCTVCNEALCSSCDKFHRVTEKVQNHKICPIEDNKSETTTLELCAQHEDKRIEMYCMDHQVPCCAICVTVKHRKCDHIKTLNDAAKEIQDSREINELSDSLKAMIDELSTVLKGRKSNQKLMEKEKLQYQDKITRMRHNINKHLDLLEERMNQELGEKYKESSILIANDIAEVENNLKVISNYQRVLDTGLKNVSDIQKFQEMNKIKQQHCQHSELLKKSLDEMKNHKIEIRFDNSWMNLITNLTKIGTITSTSMPLDLKLNILGGKGNKNLQSCTAKKIHCYNTGKGIADGIFLPNDKMLLVDYAGRKIIFCTLEGKVQKELSLSSHPWSIVQIDDKEAAVVLRNTQNIQYINIVNCKLGKLIRVDKKLYQAIGYNGTNLIVGGYDDNIYMIDRTGNIIKTVVSGYSTEYITCTTDRIYLTSGGKLVCFDMNGSLIFSHTNSDFKGGRGISVDKEGNIYCCGCFSNNIHQLTPDGQFIKLIVTDITYPHGIAFDNTGERFLVMHNPNNVTVYELQQ